jgi:hypothetical protein
LHLFETLLNSGQKKLTEKVAQLSKKKRNVAKEITRDLKMAAFEPLKFLWQINKKPTYCNALGPKNRPVEGGV